MFNQNIGQPSQVYPHSRGEFFSKVMFAFGMAMLVSLAGTYVGFRYLLEYFVTSPAIMWIFFAAELILVFTARIWSTKHPLNYLMFALFAFVSGLTIAPLIAATLIAVGPVLILKALAITVLMFTGTAIYAWTTQRDLSGLRGFLMTSLIGMIIVGIVGIFLPWSNGFELFVSGAGVLLFSGFIMYDIQSIKHYPENRYIDAALNLYLDIFNLFIYVLRFLLAMSRD